MQTTIRALVLILSLFIVSCSTSQKTAPPAPEPFSPQRPIPHAIEEPLNFERAVKEGFRTEDGKPGPAYFTNTYTYSIDAELVPADTMLFAQADFSYTNNSPDTLNFMVFELSQNLHKEGVPRKEFSEITGGMNITKLAYAGQNMDEMQQSRPTYIIRGTNMIVYPSEQILPGQKVNMEMEWNFKIPQSGAGGRMGYSRDNVFYLGYWIPHVATYDDIDGWFGDDFTGNSEFYFGWGTYDINVTAPEQWLVMSTGAFLNPDEVLAPSILERYNKAIQSDTPLTVADKNDFGSTTVTGEDGTLVWKFKAEKVRDVAFSATLESQWDALRTPVGDLNGDGSEDYTIINSFWRETAPLWEDEAKYSAHAISFLSEYTGISYPWPHMTSVEGADIIGGGMEYPMMTVMGGYNNPNPNIPLSRKKQALYDVTAHELAHMWVPLIVGSNERRHAWMDEGATTFHEAQARWDIFPETFSREDEFSRYLPIAGTFLEGEIMRWSDYHYPGPAYGVASYPKPASVLIALEGVLGEETFKNAWQAFMSRWAYKHPTPYDMFNTFEDVSGQDLDWFWRSWYFETWALDQAIADVSQADGKATITIKDHEKAVMPVDLTITFEDGSTKNIRVGIEDWMMGKTTTSITVDTPKNITRVEIDADNRFPDVNRQNNIWKK